MSSRRMPGLGHGLVGRGGVSVVAAVVLLAGFAPVSWADEEEPSPSPVASVEVPPPSDDPPAPSETAEPASAEPTPSPSPAPVVSEPAVAEPEVGVGSAVSGEPSDVGGAVGPVAPSPEPEPASGTGRGSVSVSGGGGVVPAALSAVLTLNGSSAVNRIVDVGATRSGFGVEVSGGSADSVTWSVDDPSVLSVAFEGSSARVTGVSEGVTRLRVRVRDGSASAEDWAWITVQTDVADTPGAVALEGAGLYPSATTDSDRWLVLSSNVTATVLAVSDKWVRLQFRDGVVGSSDDTAWASKYVVDIPPTSVAVSPATATVEAGRTVGLSGSFLQSYANDVTLAWSSSPTSVATVSTGGVVTGVSPGTATVTLTGSSSHGVRVTATARITVTAATVRVTGVTLDKTTATLTTGSTLTLTATVTPSNATNKTVTWSSSNTAVATITPTGTVTGKTGGTATITVTTIDGGKTATATITVTVPVTGVRLNKTSATVPVGATVTLAATVLPSTATNKAVTWKSSNTNVATVSATGVVTGKTAGTATVTVTTVDGGKTATARVTVTVPVTGVRLNKTSATVPVGATVTLAATVLPSTATNKAVSWSTSNSKVATVSAAGVVTGKAAGTATVTVKTSDGGKTATARITVVVVRVTGVTLNKTSVSMAVGGTTQLSATVLPKNATNRAVTWTSSNSKVAAVSPTTGLVTGKGVGTATVTVKTSDGGKTAKATITVRVPVTSVSLPAKATVRAGATITLTPTVKPSNATNKTVTWTSSNTKTATVATSRGSTATTPKADITGKAAGTVKVTVKTADGGKTATTTVTVTAKPTLSLTGSMTIPNPLKQGTPVPVKGTVKSNYPIAKVTAKIVTSAGKTLYSPSATPKATSYNTANLDAKLPFRNLGAGSYSYIVTATDINGTTKTLRTTKFTVTKPTVKVTGVKLNKTTLSLTVAASGTLTADVVPSNATNKKVTWTSSNTSVASVNGGKVTAKKVGTATITVKTSDGGKTATAKITVTAAASTLAITGVNKVPNPLTKGKAVTVTGKVSSKHELTNVTAKITGVGGSTVKCGDTCSATTNPAGTTFNLSKWDSTLRFSKLAVGTYTYTITATDKTGSKATKNTTFTVKTTAGGGSVPTPPNGGRCPSGSKAVPQITEGWVNGKKIPLVLCAINGTRQMTIKDSPIFAKSFYKGVWAYKVSGIVVTVDAADSLVAMQRRAKEDHVTLTSTMSYRSYNEQLAIYDKVYGKNKYGLVGNYSGPARAGRSNHQGGRSVDLYDPSYQWVRRCKDGGTAYDRKNDKRCFEFYDDVYQAQNYDAKHWTYKPVASSSAKSTLKISGQADVPKTLYTGQAVAVAGKVTSGHELTRVTATITGSKYAESVNPSGRDFNLASWNTKLLFSKLPVGNYTYIVTATDSSPESRTLQKVTFEVKKRPVGKEQVTAAQLKSLGWKGVTTAMVRDLNDTLREFDISSKKEIWHFIAQCGFETSLGKSLLEIGDQSGSRYGEKYQGAGYIQLTGKGNYAAFGKYVGDSKVVSEGFKYVSKNYPWKSAGFWWKLNGMKAVVNSKGSAQDVSDKVSRRVNGSACSTERQRFAEYKRVAKVI